jgi:hypothetical protein
MSAADTSVEITFRIPGDWSHPGELLERMPEGYRLTPEKLVLPDESEVEFIPMRPDDQFAQIFRSSSRQPARAEELAVVDRYTVNVGLTGPGGSMESALRMMQAAAAIVRAGGAGVFIDNSALAHGGSNWIAMAEDGGPDALSFAYVSIVRGKREVWTMGMHALGFPDIVMRREDADADDRFIIEVIRYISSGEKPVGDGHLLCDLDGVRFQTTATAGDPTLPGPMHNPFGRLRLTSIKEIAENN